MQQSAYILRNEDFIDRVVVVCPKCYAKALVIGGKAYEPISNYENCLHFSCKNCAFSLKFGEIQKYVLFVNSNKENITSSVKFLNAPVDPFFGFDVWYKIETKYGVLWAYNVEHLAIIEQYIQDKLRSRNGLPNKNNSIGSRLPQWVKSTKNRDYLLKIISKLKLL